MWISRSRGHLALAFDAKDQFRGLASTLVGRATSWWSLVQSRCP